MKDDQNLKHKLGTKNHFTVPDDYFKNLVPNIMAQLPEQERVETPHIRLWDRVKPWIYMAAMFCGLIFTIRAVVNRNISMNTDDSLTTDQFSELPDEYIDPIIDQIMVDDYTLYVYLSEADDSFY